MLLSGNVEDCKRIIKVLFDRGYIIDIDTAYNAWSDYSDEYSSGWLALPDSDEELFNRVMSVVLVEE